MPKCNCEKDNCLPPAVLQINNQECPVVFHKVIVPAAMGDDVDNPPRNGQYRNVLLVYEANGHVYMFSSDGIPTLISDGGQGVDDYNELTNKPSIEGHELVGDSSLEDIGVTDAIEDALEDYTPTSELAEVAFTGDYEDLENTPTPPTTHFYRRGSGGIDDPFPFYNDAGYTDQTTYQQFEDAILSGPVQVFHEYDAAAYMIGNVEMMNAEVGSGIAFWVSGEKERQVFQWMSTDSAPVLGSVESYSYQPDWNANNPNSFAYIRNKPTIPAAQVNSDWDAASGVAQILNKPSLATVATTGSYNDLTNKPTIPTVNNGQLTIQKNGSNVATFTANQSGNSTANISVPTKTSDLTNDGSDNTAQYLETDETAYKTASIPYGECDSTSTATAFTATVPGITELRDGVCMWLKNGVVTSAGGFTINVNNLGAKRVYSNMSAASAEGTLFNVNYTFMFVYDSSRVAGGCWVLNRGYFSDANSVGYQLRTNSSTLPALQTGYRYRLWLTSADGQHYVPINTATGTSTTSTKALNTTTPIDPFGTIVYNATNGTVEAGANLPTGTQWTQFTLDLRYAKYPLTTLTFPNPVYLQCTPQSTGGALINDIVQTLPTTEDGKIYIYLGNAYSTVSMELKQNHPVYYYKDGAIRLWTNAAAGISSVAWGDITGTLSSQTDLNTALGAKANSADLATVATSGSYNDLTNKPTIPTVNNATLTIAQNGTSVGTFTANASSDTTISLTDTTYSDFSGATSSAAGTHGLVPAPSAGDQEKVLHGDGTWKDAAAKLVEMSYGESNAWAKFIAAYQGNKIVYCRASSNSNPATGSQTRKAFMAYVNNADNPTEVEFQYVRSVSSKTSSQPVDQVYVYKLTSANGGTWTVQIRDMGPKLAAGTNTTVSYSNGTYTISATGGGGGGPTVVQTTGQSTTDVMSQKAVTDIIGNVETILQTLNSGNGAQ